MQWLSFTEFFLEVPFEYLELPEPLLSTVDNVYLHELAIAVWKVLHETEQEPAFPELCNTVEGLLHLPPGELLKVTLARADLARSTDCCCLLSSNTTAPR